MKTYSDIIKRNCESISPVSWWPRFAYHFSNLDNAVSIVSSGVLYSRNKATIMDLMKNENASRQVIDITSEDIKTKARFYFRPLTPTQYHTEGFKHEKLRYNGSNMPVPIFLVFDLEKLLSTPGVLFSETSQAGHGSLEMNGIEAFEALDFEKIYSNGYYEDPDIKSYRHAEILYPDMLPIDEYIRFILCRNSLERNTFMNLLKEKDPSRFQKYKSIIKICPSDMFYRNGLYVEDILYNDNKMSIEFSDNMYRRKYHEKNNPNNSSLDDIDLIDLDIQFVWLDDHGNLIKEMPYHAGINYFNTLPIAFTNIKRFSNATELITRVCFDGKTMAYTTQ